MPNSRLKIRPAPTLFDKIRRVVWALFWILFYRPSPVFAHGWRRVLLRVFGAVIECGAHPYPSAKIWAPWNLMMCRDSCLGPGVNCYSAGMITLGANSVVSQGVHLCSASHDFRESGFKLLVGEILIGTDAWVAAEAFIGPGVEIGEKAVVGARSVVTRDVDARAVVAGNPARQVSLVGPYTEERP